MINLYAVTLCLSAAFTAASIPLFKHWLASVLADYPGGLKKHTHPVPMVGGCAIFLGTTVTLVILRFITNFPTGTLHSLRGILGAGTLIFALGLIDDLRKPKGLPVWVRLLVQAVAAVLLVYEGVCVQVFAVPFINYTLTFLWVAGLTNAFNLLDIADGLCTSQALLCTAGLFVIALPGELWYVNLAAVTLLGASIAFLPFNFAKRKVFLGDSGSTFLGFMIAALSMGTQYSNTNPYGYAAPLFITAVPLLDTAFVSLARVLQGKNPLKGSEDHLALCLKRKWNLSNRTVLGIFMLAAVLCNLLAYSITQTHAGHTTAVCILFGLMAGMCLLWLIQKLYMYER